MIAVMVRSYCCVGNEKKSYIDLDPVTREKRSLARPRGRWEYKVKIGLKENLCNGNGVGLLG
jgi:hypothetical protein